MSKDKIVVGTGTWVFLWKVTHQVIQDFEQEAFWLYI